jgi:hypothetical protein
MAPNAAEAAGSRIMLLFREYEIHRPAPPDVRPLAAAVLDKGFIVATGVNQGIGKDSKLGVVQRSLRHSALLVDRFSEARDSPVVPVEDGGRKGLRRRGENSPRNSHNVTEEVTLFRDFCLLGLPYGGPVAYRSLCRNCCFACFLYCASCAICCPSGRVLTHPIV